MSKSHLGDVAVLAHDSHRGLLLLDHPRQAPQLIRPPQQMNIYMVHFLRQMYYKHDAHSSEIPTFVQDCVRRWEYLHQY